MTPPFRPSPSSTAPAPRGCGGERCASGRDAWPLHHVRHNDVFCRLCSSCVLLYHPASFCSACLLLLHTDAAAAAAAAAQDPHFDPAVAPPGPTAECSNCGLFVAHVACIPDPVSFVCPPCAAEAEGRPFTYAPAARRVMDERAARILLVAARLAHESIGRAAAAAREEAERRVQEAAVARKRSREMLDAAFRALEEEARAAKIKEEEEAAREAKNKKEKPAAAQPPKKKTPKSSESSRDRDKMLKFNAMQQPALAFAAAAAAAASSMPLSTPLSTPTPREDKKPMKLEEQQGSTDTVADEDVKGLFGTLQS
ncbi:hypothetical protein CFC21_010495 [Triticum aestivum]|uniref:Zinc finger PHD-type domain-containing protein n=2 Tax=Triticum aestivum TaxID=4565 RepID=A0A9R1IUL8_WHEAT|nr:actin cytoskeleton-regulatory complex protein pan1-like [Triticum aestivum]KAF6993630.1 hypothetical protein CFC21_010495 [Triticum aestivum]